MGELIVDSFAGGGGASLGISWALGRCPDIAINHDAEAIALHAANHPLTKHYCEDVWHVDPLEATKGQPVGLMWLSPDCKHFSKAKGGKPVSKKIRGLAWIAVRWAKAVKPRILVLENVEEFQSWGPVDRATQRPCTVRKGQTFKSFVTRLRNLGYQVEWKELRACDYGAPTIRKRLFIIARCDGEAIVWPKPTHGKGTGRKYLSAADCIDWGIPSQSIFTRKKPLVPATLERIARGLRRFVIDTDRPFVMDLDGHPTAAFLAKHFGGGYDGPGVQLGMPLHTVTSVDHHALVTAKLELGENHSAAVNSFLIAYYGNESESVSLFDPMRTVTSRDRFALVSVDGVDHGISDISMRMLAPRELYRAQGFPDGYQIDIEFNGKPLSKTAQVRMCGNSVCPPIAQAIVVANYSQSLNMEIAA